MTQVLTDGTNTYLYGLGRIGEYDTDWNYYLTDALGSVRQLTDSTGSIALAQSYAPYGDVTESAGETSTSYGFAGEWTDGTGLQYLRARYLNTGIGRFVSRDIWPGSSLIPGSYNKWSYAYNNPIKLKDPSGLLPFLDGPLAFALCFDLHSGTYGELASAFLLMDSISARQAVNICKGAYSPSRWSSWEWTFGFDQSLPQTAHQLMGWFVFNHGDRDYLWFDGNQSLTKELAISRAIHKIRKKYYQSGGTNNPVLYKYNEPEAFDSIIDFRHQSIPNFSVSITSFIGSFWYQVVTLSNGRVGFRIDNDTTLASGSHFKNTFPPNFRGSVEELILQDRTNTVGNMSLSEVMRRNPNLISILFSRSRDVDTGTLGGGNLYQTYYWSEKRDPCLVNELTADLSIDLLDIQHGNEVIPNTLHVFLEP